MEPTRQGRHTLVDLLDRVLDKGLVINADVIISLAGVPLIAVNLRAAVASIETMWQYGLMRDFIKQNPQESHHDLRPVSLEKLNFQ